jgi:hypothetical protein
MRLFRTNVSMHPNCLLFQSHFEEVFLHLILRLHLIFLMKKKFFAAIIAHLQHEILNQLKRVLLIFNEIHHCV